MCRSPTPGGQTGRSKHHRQFILCRQTKEGSWPHGRVVGLDSPLTHKPQAEGSGAWKQSLQRAPSRDSAGEEAWLTGDLAGASDIFRMGCRSGSGPTHVSLCESVTAGLPVLPVPACTQQVLKHGTYRHPGSFFFLPVPRTSQDHLKTCQLFSQSKYQIHQPPRLCAATRTRLLGPGPLRILPVTRPLPLLGSDVAPTQEPVS